MTEEEREEGKREEKRQKKEAAAEQHKANDQSAEGGGEEPRTKGPRPASLRRTELVVESLEDEMGDLHHRQKKLFKAVAKIGKMLKTQQNTLASLREQLEDADKSDEGISRLERKMDPLPESVKDIARRMDTLENAVEELKKEVGAVRKVKQTLSTVGDDLEELATRTQALEKASEEMDRLSEQHYQERVIQPMVRSIFPLYDLVEDADGSWARQEGREMKLTNLLEALRCQIEEFLAPYGVEPFWHDPGAVFDPALMQPVKKVETSREELDGTIEESWQVGFRRGERILRDESVVLRVFQTSEEGETR